MKKLKSIFRKGFATASLFLSTAVYMYSQSGTGSFAPIVKDTKNLYAQFRQIAIIIAALASIGGGVAVAFKMKNAEGGEGKKALFSYIGGLIFLILMLIVVDKVILKLT